MATVTSLTEAKIQEMVAGWEGVELTQTELSALIQQLWNNNESQDANLTEFRTVILPALEADLAAGSIRVSDLNDVTVPALQAELDQHQLSLDNLNTVHIPQLTAQLQTNADWIVELDEITLPALYLRLDNNDAALLELNDVTLPGLETRLAAVESGSGFDPTALQAEIDAAELRLNTLETETLPGLDLRLDTAEGSVSGLQGKFPITAPDIAADAVTANAIAADAVTANEIAADTITAAEIAADAITANEIAGRTITALEIAADAITANEIAADTITANEIAADAITANEIASRTITALEIAADAITANEIAADTITANEIAADTITASEIAADSITASEIAADTITANEIATDAITANEIAGRTITALEIAADAITANEIAADTITANEIATDAITANEIAGKTITALEIAANTITAAEVATDILVANTLFSRTGYFGNISADQLDTGTIKADLALVEGQLTVGQITIDPLVGITIPSPKGDTVLSALGIGSRFAGAVETDELTVEGGLTLNAANNQINGSLKLANVVVPPTQKASVSRFWPYTAPIGADTLYLTDSHDGTKWVTKHVNSSSIRTYLKTTGALVDTFQEEHWHHDYVPYNIARVGNYYAMIMWKQSTGMWALCRVGNAFGTFTVLDDSVVSLSGVGSAPAVGRDDVTGEILVAYAATGTNSGKVRLYRYTTAGVRTASELWDTNNTWDGGNWLVEGAYGYSIGRGAYGRNGADEMYMVFGGSIRFWDPVAKTIQWWPGRAESPKGVTYTTDGKLVYSGYNTYRIYEWVREANWLDNEQLDIGYAWYDSKLAGTGKHETTLSPILNSTDAWRWAGLQIDTPAPSNTGQDDSPDSVAIYIDGHRQPDVPVGKISNQYRSYVLSGIAPKATNEFAQAAAYPGAIISDATFVDGVTPRLRFKGDGTGHWGDLTVDGNGKAVIGGDSGWIPVTVFTNLWENYGSTWPTVAYRKIGNRVHLRGLIRGPGGLGGTMFVLPVGFRPPGNYMFPATTAQWAKTIDAVGDGAKDTGNKGTGTSGTSHFHDISAYDIRTTVDIDNIATRCDILSTGEVQHSGGVNNYTGAAWLSLFGISFLVD